MRHTFTFFDGSRSADEFTRRVLARRGRVVCGAYLDARSPAELRRIGAAWRLLQARLDPHRF